MNARILLSVSVLFLVVVGACSKKEASDDDDSGTAARAGMGSGGTSPKGGASGTGAASGTGGTGAGPAITSAPPAWARPADCGGIGELCPNLSGCGDRSACQLEGNVCIPAWTGGALPSRTAETPYCAAYTCMTFEQASCFCTGPAGKDSVACSSPSALAGLCAPQGSSCSSKACCDGSSCVDNGSHVLSCQQTCTSGAECSSGCCTDLYDTGVSICADADACTSPCKKRGETCQPGSSTTPNDCCRGSCLQSEVAEWDGCRPDCTTNADCTETGCCVPFSNSTSGFCADARFCSCSAIDARCGDADPFCCEGAVCVRFASETDFGCRAVCTSDADCGTGRCSALTDGSSACRPLSTGGMGGMGGMGGSSACLAVDSVCGLDHGECCAGTLCVTDAVSATGICGKPCLAPSDCTSACCGDIGEASDYCLPSSACQL